MTTHWKSIMALAAVAWAAMGDAAPGHAESLTLASPDGWISVTVSDDGGQASYAIAFAGAEVIAPSDRHYLQGHVCFKDQMVLAERLDGLDQVRVRSYDGGEHYVDFPEASYAAGLDANLEYEIDQLRLSYQSMVTPKTVFDYDLAERSLISRKVQVIPSGYDASQYATERLMAPARDGAMVPLSIVY